MSNKYILKNCRIYFYIERFPPEISGAGLQIKNIGERISSKSMSVFFITITTNRTISKLQDNKVKRIFIRNRTGILSNIIVTLKLLLFILNDRNKINILQLSGLSKNVYAIILWSTILNIKTIYRSTMLGGDDPNSVLNERFGKLKLKIFGITNAFIATTPKLFNIYKTYFPAKKISLIPNGVDCSRFYPAKNINEKVLIREKLGINTDRKIIVSTGVVCARKRTIFIIEALRILIQNNIKKFVFINIGSISNSFAEFDKNYVKELLSILKDIPVENIILIDHTDNVNLYLRAADIFVFASKKEGFPNALLEAMASGLPVVMTKLPSLNNFLIQDSINGFIIETYSEKEKFAKKIKFLLKNESNRKMMSQNSVKKISNNFSINFTSQLYYNFYLEILKKIPIHIREN